MEQTQHFSSGAVENTNLRELVNVLNKRRAEQARNAPMRAPMVLVAYGRYIARRREVHHA